MTTNDPIAGLRRRRPDLFDAPDFWRTDLAQIHEAVAGARKGTACALGRSAGGREIPAVAYGPFEPQRPTATISSALGSDRPQTFFDPALRTRPVLVLIGAIHGGEAEGVAVALDLIHLLETETDTAGRRRPDLSSLLEKARLVIVPCLNPDGRARAGVRHLNNAELDDLFLVQQGLLADGSPFRGRKIKEVQPIPPGYLRFMGGYYNDEGVNLQHDDFFGPRVCPENAAARDLFRREIPDGFLTLHAHGAPAGLALPDAYLGPGYQRKQSEASSYILSRLAARGHEVLPPDACTGPPWSFYFQTWLHHMTGALPLLCELPHGLRVRPCPLERILDAGATVVTAWLDYAIRFGLRPPSPDFYGKPPPA